MADPLRQRIENFLELMQGQADHLLGYPSARDYDYRWLAPLLNLPFNNIGDPFVEGTMHVSSRDFEREVIEFWAELFRAPKDNWWGYVTNGGTEGNLYGLYLARESFPDGIVYYSQDTHYSVSKNLHFLNMRNIMIRALPNGEIDYDDLRETLRINRDLPPIIFANIGTTMTEARDDIAKICEILKELAIPAHYIHSDAALCGAYAPFLDPKPSFDFADGCDSIALSGHKFIGAPMPCGIVIARKSYVNKIARSVAYIGNLDTTVTGSRNGLTPLLLWYATESLGAEGLKTRIAESLEMTEYTINALRDIGIDAWSNPNALTVVMPQLDDNIIDKWQLATANGISHIMLMPGIARDHIDALCRDIANGSGSKA